MNGSLVVYSMHVAWKYIVKIAAHAGESTSLDWHPTRPYVIASGGAGDRCVKGKLCTTVVSRDICGHIPLMLFSSLECREQRQYEA